MRYRFFFFLAVFTLPACAQDSDETPALLKQVLQRMDALEQENRQLVEEIHALRQQVDSAKDQSPGPAAAGENGATPVEDRVAVNEQRIHEQAQTKVEASQKFPISLNGMLLFNAFANSASPGNESAEYGVLSGPNEMGATLRQTLLGFDFQGPSLPGDGRVNASVLMDFWAGTATPGNNWFRLRRADISLDWPNRSFTVGQDKPLIAPYQPDSLAEVGIPPLAGAGNLWLWLPQARYEERFHLGAMDGLTGQLAVMQTAENYQTVESEYSSSLELARPALEGRIAYWHKFDDVHHLDIGSGFHISTTHVAGTSVPSQIASLDWNVAPIWKVGFSGTMYTGQNVAGLGALGNEFTILRSGNVLPVHTAGGWAQVAIPLTSRLTFNLFGGIEDDRGTYLQPYNITRDLTYASNLMYHLGPNVVLGIEGLQMRTRFYSGISQLNNHYDLALGYLF